MSHKMSISIPEITITKKQFFGEDVELQVYDNKLYITMSLTYKYIMPT